MQRFIPAGAGNTERRRLAGFARRFIPAGAGNTMHQLNTKVAFPVYPRWRGEHTDCGICSVQILGLSPLARGTLNHQPDHQLPHRFIPAGAGNTMLKTVKYIGITVYPRWRGEHVLRPCCTLARSGLSPLARGTRKYGPLISRQKRFIPAGAGNTTPSSKEFLWKTVYPRWRGEHTKHT